MAEAENVEREGATEKKKPYDPLDPEQSNISDANRALEAAYNAPEVSMSMILVGAAILAALVGIILALVFFTGN